MGFNVTPTVQIVGTFSHMNDTLTGSFAQLLRTAGAISGLTIEGKLPVDYGAGGVRFVVANQETVQVFIQAEGGVGKVTSELRFFDRGTDVTDQIDVDIDQTKGALALSGGARALLGQALTAEVSFKWLNVLTDTETLKVNRLDFGFGVRF